MSNELECEIQIFDQFERNQQSQETQKLLEFVKQNIQVAWAAMMKKQHVKSYLPIKDGGRVVWSAEVMEAVYCSCTQEIECLHQEKSDEVFDPKLNLVSS